MEEGDIVAGRFEIEALAAAGGMGLIFRARDRQSGEPVAVKVLLGTLAGHEALRFVHETRALAELSHPGIVRYVAHGVAGEGVAYLAMEWLDGEDLARRIQRAPLTVDESLRVATRVAEALGAAHAQGIVHRDLKPSNIFLVGEGIDQVKVLDFGIARLDGVARVTRTGTIVGTPGYMAPEQVQDEGPIDARADVFSLGCVLFECVTGMAAFSGTHLMAILGKVLFAEPARLRDIRPDAPPALEQLLLRMMAKDPNERPRDGAAVLEALRALADDAQSRALTPPKVALTSAERRTVSVVLIEADPTLSHSNDTTLVKAAAAAMQALRKGAETFGGRLEYLRDGSAVVSIVGAGLATDQAAQAARCALWLRAHVGGRAVALATGRFEVTGGLAAAEAIDRAAKLLDARASTCIAIDDMTARLLDGRFDVREDEAGALLHGERAIAGGARLLLTKPTACVGRDRELTTLMQMFAACVDESQAHVALVTAAPGMGKSRLVHELLARLRERDEPIAVWIARGDVLRAGSALGLLAEALRGVCGIRGDEPLPERREKLFTRVAQRLAAADRQRVAELLGEIMGVPFPDDSSELLRAARRNAQIMTDEMRRAWLDFFRAECAAQPVLLVLEDLHWGDLPTVQFVDAALRDHADKPWTVLAMARPEVHTIFPKLWEGRDVQEIKLKPLGKKASERLVRQVLGDEIGADTVERLITQADGNAFYLEELIRAAAERKEDHFPETVVAMVQSRLAALGDEDRRALRAASVFGEVFWPGGVAALLDDAERAAEVQSGLLNLVEREVLVQRSESRFAGQIELAFRHVLLREGAYGMLTDEDRMLGHRLAGGWLEQVGERDPRLLAEHFDRGGEGERAAAHYLRAAEMALEGGDYEAAIKLVERGVVFGRDRTLLSELCAVEAEARLWSGDVAGASLVADAALDAARPGSRTEGRALLSMTYSAMHIRNNELLGKARERLLHTDPEPDAIPLLAAASCSVITSLLLVAQPEAAKEYRRRIEHVAARATNPDPITLAWVELSRAMVSVHVDRDPWGLLLHAREAVAQFERSGAGSTVPYGRVFVGCGYWFLGLFNRAEEEFARILLSVPVKSIEAFGVEHQRVGLLLVQRRLDEVFALGSRIIQEMDAHGNLLMGLTARLYVIEAHLYKGETDIADAEALALREVAAAEPSLGMFYLTVLACIRLAQGRAQEASELAERALSQSRACGMGYFSKHAMLLLVRAEAFHALGDHAAARQAIREARDDLLRRAAMIPDSEPEIRRSFLQNLPDHRRTLELAREWLGDDLS